MSANNFGELQRQLERERMIAEMEAALSCDEAPSAVEEDVPGIDEHLSKLERMVELLHEIKGLRDELFPPKAETESD